MSNHFKCETFELLNNTEIRMFLSGLKNNILISIGFDMAYNIPQLHNFLFEDY